MLKFTRNNLLIFRSWKFYVYAMGCCITATTLYFVLLSPSNDRNWSIDQAILPYAEFNDDEITIRNIRNFEYRSTTDFDPGYYDETFHLSELKGAYYVVEPFGESVGAAHTLLSFEFNNDRFVAVSVEVRKEQNETFSALKGLFKKYELMYVIADERDVIKLRSNHRNDPVYVYPVQADIKKIRHLFTDILIRANKLHDEPEFYNTVWNNCTTNIARHVNTVTPKKVKWNLTLLLPAQSDHYAYDLGLIDNTLPFSELRQKYLINDRAIEFADDPDFSRKIRIQ